VIWPSPQPTSAAPVVGEVLRASDKSLLALGQLRGLPGDQGAARSSGRPSSTTKSGCTRPSPRTHRRCGCPHWCTPTGIGCWTHSRSPGRRRVLPRTAAARDHAGRGAGHHHHVRPVDSTECWRRCSTTPTASSVTTARGSSTTPTAPPSMLFLEEAGPVWQANHGDRCRPTCCSPSGGCVLLDIEFTGLFLPGFDVAMLHTCCRRPPARRPASRPWWTRPVSRCRSWSTRRWTHPASCACTPNCRFASSVSAGWPCSDRSGRLPPAPAHPTVTPGACCAGSP
jgi:hypothetical protein